MIYMGDDIQYVSEKRVSCGGDGGILSHPVIYMNIGESESVTCGYCNKKFVYANEENTQKDE